MSGSDESAESTSSDSEESSTSGSETPPQRSNGGNKFSEERHRGIVRRFMIRGAHGWIHWEGGSDIYVHSNNIRTDDPLATPRLYEGDPVEFRVGVNGAGKRKALDVVADPDGTQKKIRGTVVEWINSSGYGFIRKEDGTNCRAHRLCGAADAFLRLRKGETVEFEETVEPEHGRQMAVRVKTIKGTGGKNPASWSRSNSKERHRGKVIRFMLFERFGYIRWDGNPHRLLVLAENVRTDDPSAIPRLFEDDVVEFAVGSDRKGRPHAVDVVVDPDGTRKRVRGKCVRMRNGSGLIEREGDGAKISVLSTAGAGISELILKRGDTVEYEERRRKNSHKYAVRVRVVARAKPGDPGRNRKRRRTKMADSDSRGPPAKRRKVGQ